MTPYKPKYPLYIYKMFFLYDFESGEPAINIEISDIGFFELSKLPKLSKRAVFSVCAGFGV
ncbi:hypothetical protein CTM89_15125 [Photobacterium leiognathi]|uniref:Uncharacterized protein n=2 Tax=Photobacterium leiognathi TaxID=553611 RepID=A0A2T3M7P8_PHOLE|nr:hypothetical protein CTM89_15125 [Photobacterium leiognathi]